MLTEQQMRDRLRAACGEAGGIKAWAAKHGLTATFVHYVLKGQRQSSRVAHALGLEPVRFYLDKREAE